MNHKSGLHSLQSFGDYELLGEIAGGAMGMVYLARQISLNRTVALKMIRSGKLASATEVKRFETEAEAAANLDHPNIVPIYEIGEHEGQHYFSMKLIEGGHLAELIAREWKGRARTRAHDSSTLREWSRRAARLVATVARAVHHAHQRGVLHRDLKPTNILLDEEGQPHLTDFGLAKLLDRDGMTQSLALVGTPSYMAPEQAAGKVRELTTAVDIYSLGAILYELLGGHPPFQAESTMRVLAQVQEVEPEPLRNVSPGLNRDLETICFKCLEKAPAGRYATALALAEDLERFLRGESILARPATSMDRAVRWCRRKPALASALGALFLAMAGGFIGVLWQWQRANASARNEAQQRQSAEQAVFRLTFDKAEVLFEQDRAPNALAYLARLLRQYPTNEIVAARIQSALSLRGFCLPVAPLSHSNRVIAVQMSPDGRCILTAGQDKKARMWDAENGRLLAELKPDAVPTRATWSPDGGRILIASIDGAARLWGVKIESGANGDLRVATRLMAALQHDDAVNAAEFSPRGDRIVTGSKDRTVRIWNARNGEAVGEPLVHPDAVEWARFSPDGGRVATLCAGRFPRWFDGRVWDVETRRVIGEPIKDQRGEPQAVFTPDGKMVMFGNAHFFDAETGAPLHTLGGVADQTMMAGEFSADGEALLTGSNDFWARLWDWRTGRPLTPPMRHDNFVIHASMSRDGRHIATASRDNTARLWSSSGQPASEPIHHDASVWFAQLNSNGTRLVTRPIGNTAWLWETPVRDHQIPTFRHEAGILSLRFSRDGKRLLTTAKDTTARVWDVQTGRLAFPPLPHHAWVDYAEFSPDEQTIVTAAQDGGVRLWDASNGQRLSFFGVQHRDHARFAEFSPDGKWILSASFDGTARVTDIASNQLVSEFSHGKRVHVARFSPDGRRVVTAAQDRTARVWDALSGQPLSPPMKHEMSLIGACFTLDGRRVITASQDRTARVWDGTTGQPLTPPVRHPDELQRRSPDLHPDGRRAITAAGTIARIWDIDTGNPTVDPLTHFGVVRSAMFSRNGRHVVTTSKDKTARLWDTATGLPISEPLPHDDAVFFAEFSADGRWVASGNDDGGVVIWEVPLAPNPIPTWLPDLAEAVGGLRFNADNMLEAVPTKKAWQLRQQLALLRGPDPWTAWANWFFNDASHRPFWPGFPVKPTEFGKER